MQALRRVPVFTRGKVQAILDYNAAFATFLALQLRGSALPTTRASR